MLLLVSFREDPHLALVTRALTERSFTDFACFDLLQFSGDYRFTLGISLELPDTATFQHDATGETFCGDDVFTIWWRREHSLTDTAVLHHPGGEHLDAAEAFWAIRSWLFNQPAAKFPFGHPTHIAQAENKIRQLSCAKDVGFTIPRTILSNDPRELQSFLKQSSEVVVKPFHTSFVPSADARTYSLIAKRVSTRSLDDALRLTETTFLLCQELITKTLDVRVTVFPDGRSVACAIDTSSLPANSVDWRPHVATLAHESIACPERTYDRIQRFLAKMGLRFGAFDFGVRPDGEWVFFECNPNGQWLWVELKTGVPLARYVADILIRHHETAGSASQFPPEIVP